MICKQLSELGDGVKDAMAKIGMSETHYFFMVMFIDDATGGPGKSGIVAAKIETPSGKGSKPVELMGMQAP